MGTPCYQCSYNMHHGSTNMEMVLIIMSYLNLEQLDFHGKCSGHRLQSFLFHGACMTMPRNNTIKAPAISYLNDYVMENG